MAEVKIIYWSGTGNTAAMAQSVADGVAAAGAEAKIIPVENAGAADIADVKAFALGCPSMGAEQLEESSMEKKSLAAYPAKRSCYSDPMAGEMANGCATGWNR